MPRHKAQALDSKDPSLGIDLQVPCLTEMDEEQIRGQLARDHFFWLDLIDPSEAEVERLGELFEFHPLALEDTLNFGQRPKLDDFGSHVLIVPYGIRGPRSPAQ